MLLNFYWMLALPALMVVAGCILAWLALTWGCLIAMRVIV